MPYRGHPEAHTLSTMPVRRNLDLRLLALARALDLLLLQLGLAT